MKGADVVRVIVELPINVVSGEGQYLVLQKEVKYELANLIGNWSQSTGIPVNILIEKIKIIV